VENDVSDDTDEEEQLTEGSEPYSPLPTFPQDYVWPELLEKIISFGKKPEQYNPQIEMFARFKMKSSFHKTKRII